MNPLKILGVINLNKSNIKASQGGHESGLVQPKDSRMFLLVAVETKSFPPIGKLQASAADGLRPGYAFFLFPAFPLLWNPLRCISTARDIVLVSLTASRTVTYMPLYSMTGTIICNVSLYTFFFLSFGSF